MVRQWSVLPVDGSEIEYRLTAADRGSERLPPVVFLHDGLGSISTWRDFPDRVRQSTGHPATLVYARRGHGASTFHPGLWGPRYMQEEALEVLPTLVEGLGLHRPILVGHSDGASIALMYAAGGHPVTGLVVFAPHVIVEQAMLDGIRVVRESYRDAGLRTRLARHHTRPDDVLAGWSGAWLGPGFSDWTIEESLPRITAPVLACQGSRDEFGTLTHLESIVSRVSGPARQVVLDGVGHVPHHERPSEVLGLTVDFVRGCHPAARPGEAASRSRSAASPVPSQRAAAAQHGG